MHEDVAYIEEDIFTEEDWDDLVLKGTIELRHPPRSGKEASHAETAE